MGRVQGGALLENGVVKKVFTVDVQREKYPVGAGAGACWGNAGWSTKGGSAG